MKGSIIVVGVPSSKLELVTKALRTMQRRRAIVAQVESTKPVAYETRYTLNLPKLRDMGICR